MDIKEEGEEDVMEEGRKNNKWRRMNRIMWRRGTGEEKEEREEKNYVKEKGNEEG